MSTLCNEKLFVPQRQAPPILTALPLHVAIIMDGCTRWAARRGQPASAGVAAGAANVRPIVSAAASLGIDTLTLYACSGGNSLRSANEIRARMNILAEFLRINVPRYFRDGVRVSVIGRRDRLSPEFFAAMEFAEAATADCRELHLRVAVDYSSRETIFRAACRFYKATRIHRESFEEVLGEVSHAAPRDVDLLIRTGDEQRLSDFLLWEAANAELHFSPLMWPDFSQADLAAALENLSAREQSFSAAPRAIASL
jgi:undecaprenyl diphosphate synthase